MSQPYIGITGFKTVNQIEEVANKLTSSDIQFLKYRNLQIMLGVTASSKRLLDPTSEGRTSPTITGVQSLFKAVKDNNLFLPMIHYFSETPMYLSREVEHLFHAPQYGQLYENGLCRAIQLNQDWPSTDSIAYIKQSLPKLLIVLQLSPNALKISDEEVLQRAKTYGGLVDYILIDPSGGNAISLDLARGSTLLNRLHEALPSMHIGAAGGFGPENVHFAIERLGSGAYKKFCVDAQGKLRTEEQLDPEKAVKYIRQAIEGFSKLV